MTGETTDELVRWQDRGMIGGGSGTFTDVDRERVRLIRSFLERGVTEDAIEKTLREYQAFIDRFITHWLSAEPELYTFEEVCERSGIDRELAAGLWQASGFGFSPRLTDQDVEAMQGLKAALDGGFPPEALHQLLRVYGDTFRRITEAECRLFNIHVAHRFRAEGLSGNALMEVTDATGGTLAQLVEPTLLYFHRKAWVEAMRADLANDLAEDAGLWTTIDDTGQMQAAVVFIDLCGFTALTAAMGDLAAADVIDRFAGIVRHTVQESLGQVVKQIGDAFMLLFPEATAAVRCGLALNQQIAELPQFPASRVGVHWGPVLYRDGDYVGTNVNLAARVTAEAEPRQVMVTPSVREQLTAESDIQLFSLGRRRLRGMPDKVDLYAACSIGEDVPDTQTDPVCHMELTASAVVARATIDEVEHAFCSTGCLQRYATAPEQYAS